MKSLVLATLSLVTGAILISPASAQDANFLFALVDGNHDNVISRDESQAYAELLWRQLDPENAGQVPQVLVKSNWMARLTVGDALPADDAPLPKAVFLAGNDRQFERADLNHDASLDAGEFRVKLGMPAAMLRPDPVRTLPSLAAPFAAGLPSCAALATDPRAGLAGKPGVSHLVARIVSANSVDAAYCEVQFTWNSGKSGPAHGYDDGQQQAIGLRIGLPLRPEEGGKVAWNGRIQNVGSGGCMGLLPAVTVATNAGFASASSDGGHGAPYIAFNCGFGVIQAKHQLNVGLIRDFSAEHVRWQTYWSKALVKSYYGQEARRTYWCGCSQGGREGFIAAQVIPEEYDGILAGGAALYWQRFQMAQAWSGLVIKDTLRVKGKDLTPALIQKIVDQEVAACDAIDGLRDGELADPRKCRWSAKAALCGAATADPNACLDADQVAAFDRIRQGPVNSRGERIWNPWEPGTIFSNQTDYLLSDGIMQWAVRDLTFRSREHLYLDAAALKRAKDPKGITYEDMATLATQSTSDVADVSDPALDRAKASGVKILAWTGTADRNIHSRNTIKYYRDVAEHFGQTVASEDMREWFRLFLYPSVDHCSGGSGAQPGNSYNGPLFEALVDWVEGGHAPRSILATKADSATGATVRTRPVCAYPETAIYNGSGDPSRAESFSCGGNLETPAVAAEAKLAPIKRENGTGIIPPNYKPRT